MEERLHALTAGGLDTLTRDIEAKQTLITRLQTELDQHVDALRRITQETVDVKTRNKDLEAELVSLQQRIDSFPSHVVMTPNQIFEANRDTILLSHVGLLQRYKLSVQRNKEQLSRIQDLQNKLIKKNEVEVKMLRTRQAHTAQRAFRKSLEDKIAQSALLKATAKRQERAITQLEKLIERNAKTTKKNEIRIVVDDARTDLNLVKDVKTVPSPVFTLLKEENRVLSFNIDRLSDQRDEVANAELGGPLGGSAGKSAEVLREQIESEKLRIRRLEVEAGDLATRPTDELAALTRQAEDAERRARLVEDELLELVRQQAIEASDMEMKLLEAQTIGGYQPDTRKTVLGAIPTTRA